MNYPHLRLYEEITLLGLREEKGTATSGYLNFAIAGALLAELLLEGRIELVEGRKQRMQVVDGATLGDPLLDESLQGMVESKPASLKTWVTRLGGMKDLMHRAALQLCERGILRADEATVLLIFSRKVYPEIDSAPEQEIVERMREAIFGANGGVDPRTAVVVSIASGAGLLNEKFGRREMKERRKRVEEIGKGELTGAATKQVIAACEAAVMAAVMIPMMVSATTTTSS